MTAVNLLIGSLNPSVLAFPLVLDLASFQCWATIISSHPVQWDTSFANKENWPPRVCEHVATVWTEEIVFRDDSSRLFCSTEAIWKPQSYNIVYPGWTQPQLWCLWCLHSTTHTHSTVCYVQAWCLVFLWCCWFTSRLKEQWCWRSRGLGGLW